MEYVFVYHRPDCDEIVMLPIEPERDKKNSYIFQAVGIICNAIYYLKKF